jgi:simple sugar transport system permease protein
VSTDLATEPSKPPTPEAKQKRSIFRRIGHAYVYGSTWMLVLLAFVSALVVGAVLIVASDEPTRTAMGYFFQHPGDTFSRGWHAIAAAYSALFEGSVINTNSFYSNGGVPILGPISETLVRATPLALGGLSVALAFRAGLFNIGGQGQVLIGAICSGYVGFAWGLPPGLHVVIAVLAGAAGGAIWGGIAGFLKAKTGAHEVITTIMLNYVAFYLLLYLLSVNGFQKRNSLEPISRTVNSNALLPHLFGDNLRVNFGLLIAILAAFGVWWLLSRSTLGFRLRAVGANPLAARTAGMSVSGSYFVVMLIAGMLMGLAGATQVLGINTTLNGSIDAGIGFDAITVALLGFATPGGVVLASLLFGALNAGSVQLLANTQTPQELPQVMEAVIVLFIAAPGFVKLIFGMKAAPGPGGQLAKGWNG